MALTKQVGNFVLRPEYHDRDICQMFREKIFEHGDDLYDAAEAYAKKLISAGSEVVVKYDFVSEETEIGYVSLSFFPMESAEEEFAMLGAVLTTQCGENFEFTETDIPDVAAFLQIHEDPEAELNRLLESRLNEIHQDGDFEDEAGTEFMEQLAGRFW